MLLDILYSLGACFLWSFTPMYKDLIHECTLTDFILMRHFVFGFISLFLFFLYPKTHGFSFKTKPIILFVGFILSIFPISFFYIGLFGCTHYYKSPVLALILFGSAPVFTTLYDNYSKKILSIKKLIFPLSLMIIGLFVLHASNQVTGGAKLLSEKIPLKNLIFGFSLGIIGLFAWCFYVIFNSKFLHKYQKEVTASQLTSMTGFASVFAIPIVAFVLHLLDFSNFKSNLYNFQISSTYLVNYTLIIKTLFISVICTWAPILFWNKASSKLPGYILGPLLLSKTIFGLIIVFIIKRQTPDVFCITGSILMILGSGICLKQLSKEFLLSKK